MNAAPFRMVITPVFAALLLSISPTWGGPVVKFVSPVRSKPDKSVEKNRSSKSVESTHSKLADQASTRRNKDEVAQRPAARKAGLIRNLLHQGAARPMPPSVPTTSQKQKAVDTPKPARRPIAMSKFIDTRSKPDRVALPLARTQSDSVQKHAKSTALSEYIKTSGSAEVVTKAADTKKPKVDAPRLTAEVPKESTDTLTGALETLTEVEEQPKVTASSAPADSRNVLRDDAAEQLQPLRTTEPPEPMSPPLPLPPHLDTRSKPARETGRAIVKARIQHVAAPSVVIHSAPSSTQAALQTDARKKSNPSVAVINSAPDRFSAENSKVMNAAGIPTLIPESVNSELVERIVGRPSLIAFVSDGPPALEGANDTVHITASESTAREDSDQDGLTEIERVTVNVRPTEGELPPDHASAKFDQQGQVVQRMGASRHWMMYEFNWEASALATRPVYFEDVNLERYGYSHGLLLEPFFSAGHFFLRVPFIPYMRGADPPLQPVYTLGYGRPGTYFPYHLHRPPLSLRGALQEAAWAVGLVYILP